MEQILKLWTNVKRSINLSVIPFGEVLFLIKHFRKGPSRLEAFCNSCSTATDLSQESAKAPSGIFLVRMHALMKLLHSKSALKLQERIVILMQARISRLLFYSAQNPSRQLKIPLNIDNHAKSRRSRSKLYCIKAWLIVGTAS